MSFFLKHLRANRSIVWIMLAIQGGLFLFGVLLVLIINATLNDDQDYAALGGMMALMGTVFGGLAPGLEAPVRFRMAVYMGHTRRAYILADPAVTALNSLIGIGAAWCLNRLELWLYGLIYPGWALELDVFSYVKWWFVPVLTAGACAICFCLGALRLRFGGKGFAFIWFPLCFSPSIIGSSLNAASEGGNSLMARIGRGLLFLAGLLRPAMWCAVGIAVLLVLIVLSGLYYSRAEVRT